MVVYSTRKFLGLLLASIMVAVLLVSIVSIILPNYVTDRPTPSFSASPTAGTPSITPGSNGQFSANLKSLNGFSGPVDLTTTVTHAPKGIVASVSPSSLVLSSGGSAAFNLVVAASPTTPPGNYSITVVETSGTLSHTDTITLQVAGLTITTASTSLSFLAGSSSETTIMVTSVNGFSGNVVLVTSVSVSGPTASASPNSFSLTSGHTASSTLIVTSGAPGTFDVTVTAIGGQFYQSVSMPVTASSTSQNGGDFDLTVIPSFLEVSPGSRENAVVSLTSLNSCVCLISLSVSSPPVGFGIGIGPYIVGLTGNGTADSTLFINIDQTAAAGSYTVTVTGTSLSLSHSATLSITVSLGPVPDFSISVYPISFNVEHGSSSTTQVIVRSLGGFTGQVNLTASVFPLLDGGPSATPDPSTVFLSSGSTAYSTLTVSTTLSTPITAGYNYTVTGKSATLHMAYGFFMVVAPGSTADFSLYANPVTIPAGSSGTTTASVIANNGFNRTVTLSISAPSGFTATLNQQVIQGSGATIVAIGVAAAVVPATYSLTLTGTSGPLSHQVGVTVLVISSTQPPDFGFAASPAFLNIIPGSQADSTITLTSIFGFSGDVSLSVIPSSGYLSAYFAPTTVTLSPNGSANSTLTILVAADTPSGTYYINVNATGRGITHIYPLVTVDVGPEFTITTNPSSLTIQKGTTGQVFVILRSLGNTGTNVSLSGLFILPLIPCSPQYPCPVPPTWSFTPEVVALPAGGTGTSTLTMTSNNATTPGGYTFYITGSNGISRSLFFNVTVTSPVMNATLTAPIMNEPAFTVGSDSLTTLEAIIFGAACCIVATVSLRRPPVSSKE